MKILAILSALSLVVGVGLDKKKKYEPMIKDKDYKSIPPIGGPGGHKRQFAPPKKSDSFL